MKFLLIKWHYFWYKHHLKWGSVYTGINEKKAHHHIDKFLYHNNILYSLDPIVLEQHILKEFDRLYPNATPEERKLFSDRRA